MIDNGLDLKALETISQNFLEELQKSYSGNKSSLRFIVHQLSSSPLAEEDEIFQTLVVGGSILKKALLKKTKNGLEILKIEKEKNIYFENENDFLKIIHRELCPEVKTLALNFAYPLNPVFENGKLDGILIAATKGVKINGLVGKQIGKEIENYIFEKSRRKINVSVANDTVCLMLSGLTKYKWDELSGGIVGTGTNFALFTNNNHLANLESANFDKFDQSAEGKIVNLQSNNPGKALFEKETAGRYLYQHFNLILKEKNITFPEINSTKELNNLSLQNIPNVSTTAQELIKNSAQLIACQIAGITKFKKNNMTFVMEGSLFWKGNNYKKSVEETLEKLIPEFRVSFAEIENSAILGAAKLVS